VDFEREAVKKAGKKASGGVGPPIRQDLEIDKAGGAIDRDIGVTAAAVTSTAKECQVTWVSNAGDEGGSCANSRWRAKPTMGRCLHVHHPLEFRSKIAAGTSDRCLSKAPA